MQEKERLEHHTIRLYKTERAILKKLSVYLKLGSEGRVIGQLIREKVLALKLAKAKEVESSKLL